MRISYNWLRDYLLTDLAPDKVADILTQIGLEVENIEHIETIKGGLEGLVVGEVIACDKHPNADKLSLTIVDTGAPDLLPIVCGASNVAKGQKVIVAPVGSTLYGGGDPFTIKKSKIRGEISEGMICAEDEIGIGNDHSGIIVLDPSIKKGTPVSELFQLESDTIFEIGLTPNRIDSASHIGTARDLKAFLSLENQVSLQLPSLEPFNVANHNLSIQVKIQDTDGCIRYSGVSITGIQVAESPEWLKKRLLSIGLSPINNVVDVTNFILHETGQPLHAFDAEKISGIEIIVKTLPEKTKFVTLDGMERELKSNDLMICNQVEGMCIAGVFGGIESGVCSSTTSIFLESACFNPVRIRKTAKQHQLFTDSSFRFERGSDPNGTLFALKRAALLICEITGGQISSDIVDIYPEPVEPYRVELTWKNLDRLIGIRIDRDIVKNILHSLDIEILAETQKGLSLAVATYRVDVRREVDVIEEILRIYGYNNIGFREELHSTLSYIEHPDADRLENLIADQLTAQGLNEIMSNSLTKKTYYQNLTSISPDHTVHLFNPLSSDLGSMRQSLIFGGLEAISHNIKHQSPNLKFFEFGNVYKLWEEGNRLLADGYHERRMLALFLTGNKYAEHWQTKDTSTDFYQLKAFVELVCIRLGISVHDISWESISNDLIQNGVTGIYKNKKIVMLGSIEPAIRRSFDIDQAVWYAELEWTIMLKHVTTNVSFSEIPKYPKVRRDLALIVDKTVTYQQIKDLAYLVERKILKEVNLFDLFESEKLGNDKKSMGVSFTLQDEGKTLNDKQIEDTMGRLISAFEKKLGASLR